MFSVQHNSNNNSNNSTTTTTTTPPPITPTIPPSPPTPPPTTTAKAATAARVTTSTPPGGRAATPSPGKTSAAPRPCPPTRAGNCKQPAEGFDRIESGVQLRDTLPIDGSFVRVAIGDGAGASAERSTRWMVMAWSTSAILALSGDQTWSW